MRLRQERKRLGLNIDQLAEKVGVKRLAQSNYENGQRYPQYPYFLLLAKAGVDIHFVMFGDEVHSLSGNVPIERAYKELERVLAVVNANKY